MASVNEVTRTIRKPTADQRGGEVCGADLQQEQEGSRGREGKMERDETGVDAEIRSAIGLRQTHQ